MDNKQGDNVTTYQQNNAGHRPVAKNLVDAISEIQHMNYSEAEGAEINPNYFTWQMSIEFFAIGFKSFVSGFLLCLFLIPTAVAAAQSMIHLYGGEANIYDKFFMFFLAFGLSFGALAIVISTAQYVRGITTYQMVKTLYTGAIMSALIKGLFLFFIFQIAGAMISPSLFVKYIKELLVIFPSFHNENLQFAANNLVVALKEVFRISAVVMLIFSFIACLAIGFKWIKVHKIYLKYKYIKDYTNKGDIE